MANKARTPMTTAEEIIAWAEKTREANGEAFTMLNKEEQLLIAKFMLAMRDHIKNLQSNMGDKATEDKSPTPSAESKREDEGMADDGGVVDEEPNPMRRQTNMDYFKANNVSMNRAFELYQTWADCDPENRIVIDEKRRAYVKSAGFAFWLNLPHE